MASEHGSGRDLLPGGDALRRAVRWMSDRKTENPELTRAKIVEEAAVRFDLTPLDVEFLLKNWGPSR